MMDSQIFSIWKEVGMTSYDVVNIIKKKSKDSKVGHCGTLDPFADGVILICTGNETKNINNLMDLKKEYIADIILGCETDTLDNTGSIIKKKEYSLFNQEKITGILNQFIGNTEQIPPYFSALKFKGKPLYKYARKDIFIRKKPRMISIYDIKLLKIKKKMVQIYVKCGKGTYIRSLARDIAYKLNTYAYVNKLTRTKVGTYNKDNAINFKNIKECFQSIN